ncbi:hypothetical protein [Flavivirga jejuensis]|uniref:Uncharacterized protein n=1 Tax=Flavivirga jejuensis TaxID=870487 RepID=A0ABT8WMB5_9FLAO|nr:hypothetical protein [Flavivirga jejuensis]MDO5974258.1 hypothetical protein [Flavivirga jejuensis]
MKSELQLIRIAEMHDDDNVANTSMKILQEKFDPTYKWCQDCDGLVVKEKECCINNILKEEKPNPKVDCLW